MEKGSANGFEDPEEQPDEGPDRSPDEGPDARRDAQSDGDRWSAVPPEGTAQGFGFRTGKRSSRVAFGFAVFVLLLGTVLVVLGGILLAEEGLWAGVALLVLVEAGFVAAFRALARMARQRKTG